MRIERFKMERNQCLYEHEVRFNLSESGVLPLTLNELLDEEQLSTLAQRRISYPPSTGSPTLRDYIADFYDGADGNNVQVVNGGAEANFITLWGLLEPGDRFAFMVPAYLQGLGLGRAWARRTDTFRLKLRGSGANRRWALDRESLARAVGRKTRAIFVTNPNNPSGGVLDEDEMQFIVRTARRTGAWIIADEIYRGAELQGSISPTFWGRYEKTIITSGLSKAFALPGLRVGWILGPAAALRRLAQYHDYTTLTPNLLSDHLAAVVMEPRRRAQILARTRSILQGNLPRLEKWITAHGETFDYVAPLAGAIAFVRYRLPIGSEALFNRLRREYSVLITPGAHFGLGKYLRIGYGYDIDKTLHALRRTEPLLQELKAGG